MKLRSFRLRLALWSALLAGIALLSFAAAVDWQFRHDKLATLDKEIQLYIQREASHPSPPADYWQHIETGLNDLISHGQRTAVILLVQANAGENYQSAHWPNQLQASQLSWPKTEPLPPPPEQNQPWNDEFPQLGFDASPPLSRRPPPPSLFSVTLRSFTTPATTWRLGLAATPFMRLAIGVDLAVIDAELVTMRRAFLWAMPLVLLLIGLGAGLLSGRALTPLRRLTSTMQQVSTKGLNQRIDLGTEDKEFTELITVFNAMLERLERGFFQASRFSADAAHELKTPLAILQGQIEQAMSQVEAGSLIQIRLSSILEEVQRLGIISRKLLLLSLADAGQLRLQKKPVNLSQALNDLLEDTQMLAPELEVAVQIAPDLSVEADAELIQQVLHNLMSNAIKYNLPADNQGWIGITAQRRREQIEVVISNTTLNPDSIDAKKIFERFYRADASHSRQIEGVGLGLSLAREIALAHGGDLLVTKAQDGKISFLLRL